MSGKSAELEKFVMLETLGKGNVVEVVEAVDRVAEGLIVFLLDQQVVVRIVDGLDVQLGER